MEVTNANIRLRLRFFGWLALLAIPLIAPLSVRTTAAVPPTVVVKMLDMPPSFDPKIVTIAVGATVEWRNVGNSVHHATDDHEMAISGGDVASPNGAAVFDSGFMRPGETFTHTFTKPGVYKYVCVAHEASGMTGEIVVK